MRAMSLTGDWGRLNGFLSGFDRKFIAAIDRATGENIKLGERTVVMHLKSQDLGWKPLTDRYRRRKRRFKRGGRLSEKTLIATATYFKSITAEKFSPFEGAVGVLRQARYQRGEKIANIAMVHEFGTKNRRIPARPLWKPSLEEITDKVLNNYDKAVNRVVKG
jgi:hypothetical protein